MARLAIIAFLLAVIVMAAQWLLRMDSKPKIDSTEMVQDPNCETYVPRPEAVVASIAGEEQYFCSQKCADEYQEKTGNGTAS